MLDLGKQIGRQRAHDAVYDAAQASVTESRPFREMLAADPHVSDRLTAAQVEALLDPAALHRALSRVRGARRGERAGHRRAPHLRPSRRRRCRISLPDM